jgi:hypothetical protein
VRQIFMSRLADRVTGRTARRIIPRLEREVAALGRSFGEHCVESTAEQRERGDAR